MGKALKRILSSEDFLEEILKQIIFLYTYKVTSEVLRGENFADFFLLESE